MYRTQNPNAPGMHNTHGSHVQVSYQDKPGFLQQVQGSFFAVVTGILLVLLAFPVLYWNEGRAVQTALSLEEGLSQVVPLHLVNTISQENFDKLVHLTANLHTDMVLSDSDYGVGVKAVKLRREVEMYQWVEQKSTREHDEGNRKRVETTYSYSLEWNSHVVRSHEFNNRHGHENPSEMAVLSYTKEASQVQAGAFTLSKGLVDKITDFQPLYPNDVPMGKNVHLRNGVFYHSRDPSYPSIGDLRVRFSFAGFTGNPGSKLGNPIKVSIVARQHGSALTHYHTKSGDLLELLYPGEMSAEEIFDAEHSANSMLTWVLRAVGWFMLFLGFQLMTNILHTLVSWLPIVRELVGLGLTLISLSLATSLSLVTIAIGWIAHRPLLGVTLLVAAAVPIYLSRRRAQKYNRSKNSGE